MLVAGIGNDPVRDRARDADVVVGAESQVAEGAAHRPAAPKDEIQIVAVGVDEVDRVLGAGANDRERHVVVVEQGQSGIHRGARGLLQAPAHVVALGERAVGYRPRHLEAVLRRGHSLGVGALLMVKDGVGPVEAVAGQALLVAEITFGVAERDVVLARHFADDDAVQHHALPSRTCSRSMLSNSARKFPAPNP